MQRSCEPDVKADVHETTALQLWMRRLWPAYCLLAAVLSFCYALWDPYQIDGDALAYMDIGDLIRAHRWAGIVNGYWNPLYPATLSLGHWLFHATRWTELHAYYMVNFGIFLLEMLAVVCFTDALVKLRERCATVPEPFVFDRWMLRYAALAVLVTAGHQELSMGKVRPDALLQALLLFGMAALLQHLATNRLRYAALMGFALGLGYLTKSFAFLFALLSIAALMAFLWIWQRQRPVRILAAGVLGAVCFGAVAGPYVAALSKQKGRFDFGDSGGLNYAWYVGGTEKFHLQNDQKALFGTSEVHLKHPNKVLLQTPLVVSYSQLPYGTYPDWFDPSFWNDHVKTHMNLSSQLRVLARDAALTVRYLLDHPSPWLLLVVLLLLGARPALGWRPGSNAFWLAPLLLGVAVFGIYGLVNIEQRYVTVGFLAILLTLLASLRPTGWGGRSGERLGATVQAASALVFLLALLAAGESLRVAADLRRFLPIQNGQRDGWYDANIFEAAKALHAAGVEPGDTIACIGARACVFDGYWARLAGVRMLTEVFFDDKPVYPELAAMPNREQMLAVVRAQGAKVMVGYFQPGSMTGATPASAGWRQLGDTPYYEYPLNLTQPSSANPTPTAFKP